MKTREMLQLHAKNFDQEAQIEFLQNQLRAKNRVLKELKYDDWQIPSFNGNYNYGRHNVADLSQLISRYLYDKPPGINANRVFKCVSDRFFDLQKHYLDNPHCYRSDIIMLLGTCASSSWFDETQLAHINEWLKKSVSYHC